MLYYSCGSDKYTEIKMCDLELFSKIWSHILAIIYVYYNIRTYVQYVCMCVYIHTILIKYITTKMYVSSYVLYVY